MPLPVRSSAIIRRWAFRGDQMKGIAQMADRFKAVLLFGMPGSGKGTQGKMLGVVPGFHHLATGDIFRSLDRESDLGRLFLQYSSKGELVPDDVTIQVWKRHVDGLIASHTYNPKRDVLLLDGMPRSLKQAEVIGEYIDVLQVVHLVARDESKMVERMRRRAEKEGRHDDAMVEVIRNRFSVYRNETQPVLDHYGKELVSEIDAINTPGRVLLQVLSAVLPVQERYFGNALEG